jgi:hypothetical protein
VPKGQDPRIDDADVTQMNQEMNMKTIAGVWMDHRKAVIATVTAEGEETMEIHSNVESQPGRFDGVRSTAPFEAQQVKADDSHEREYTGHLNPYYDRVIAAIRDAEAILIFGPGEAKGQLRKRLDGTRVKGRILEMETADEMTDRQIAAKVREYFQK